MAARWRRLLPGLWAGVLLCIALVATPAPFAALPAADAGRVVSRIFAQEAWFSLAMAALLLWLEPGRSSGAPPAQRASRGSGRALLWTTVGCTLLGYFAVQALMPAARAGQGPFSFGQLHLLSVVFFGLKTLVVLALVWRASGN